VSIKEFKFLTLLQCSEGFSGSGCNNGSFLKTYLYNKSFPQTCAEHRYSGISLVLPFFFLLPLSSSVLARSARFRLAEAVEEHLPEGFPSLNAGRYVSPREYNLASFFINVS